MNQPGITVCLSDLIALRAMSRGLNFMKPHTVYTDNLGGFVSGFRGRGMDFEEVRIYQAGDDIRMMDWRVTARTGRPHTKIFRQERERPVFIVMDYSPSLFFGTRRELKSVTASKAAAIIAWAAMHAGDRVGAIIAAPTCYIEHRPKAHTAGVLPLLKTLSIASDPYQNHFTTDLAGALQRLYQVIRPGSLVFLLSDFQSFNDAAKQQLALLAQHNDMIGCFIYDILEKEPPPANDYCITDGENTQTISTYSQQFCEAYRQYFLQHQAAIATFFARYGMSLLTLSTQDDIVKTMNKEIGRRG